jgi:hypothetical protein
MFVEQTREHIRKKAKNYFLWLEEEMGVTEKRGGLTIGVGSQKELINLIN